ncbi:MAG: hypothetical protein K2H93_01365 [Oscillospiraceae bacterium]|nr:hypothetical protein [Oscillospiraceae bacterium]
MEIPDMSHYGKCRMMMRKHERHHMLRFKLVAFLMLINAYGYIHSPIEHVFIYSVITLAISLFAVPEKPKLLAITCILLLIGIIGNLIRLYFGIPMLLLFLSQIPETKQAV